MSENHIPRINVTEKASLNTRVSVKDEIADPLLGCLENISKHYDRSVPSGALIVGLPLVEGRLTPSLFVRAAERAGLSAKIVKRPLDKIKSLLLPAVLLLDNAEAVIFLKSSENEAEILIPETGSGVEHVGMSDLAKQYTGYAILVKPLYRRDEDEWDTSETTQKNWFWESIYPLLPTYLQVILAAAFVNLLGLAAPLFIMNVYDRVLPNKALTTLWVLAIGMLFAIFFDFVFRTLRNALLGNAGRRADVLLAGKLFQHVLKLDVSQRPENNAEFANKLREYETIREFFTSSIIVTCTDFLFVWIFILIIYQIADKVAIVPAVAVLAVLLVGLILQYPIKKIVARAQSERTDRQSILSETLTGLETIKCLRAESQIQQRWERFVSQNAQTAHKLRFVSNIGLNLTAFIQQLNMVGVIIVGFYLFDQGEITPGALIAAVILSGRAVGPLGQIAATLARSQHAYQALNDLNRIMLVPEEGQEQKHHFDKAIGDGILSFENVTFTYPQASAPAISNLNLRIEPGERIGIIGKIGSGKTTLGRLIARLYLPTSGSFQVDGVDIGQYHPSEIRRNVALISPDDALFLGSVRDNIVLGIPHVSDEKVLRAAELTGVTEFVKTNPLGFNMPVGEGGRLLSAGQQHAIRLARAFVLNPKIIFLDEPTSSMDLASERKFVKMLMAALQSEQTLIITTHRIGALSLVSRLAVIDNGRIVADGPKDRVLKALEDKDSKPTAKH